MYNIYLPAGWVIFFPPAQAKKNIAASVISAVSAKNFRFNCLVVFLPGQLPFLRLRTFLIFTHPGEHGQICSMSKSKCALKTTNIIYAVWLGIYAVSACHFLVEVFKLDT